MHTSAPGADAGRAARIDIANRLIREPPAGCRRSGRTGRICGELRKQLWEDVPLIPMGEYWQATAYRKDLVDVLPGCFAVFYGVRRV